MQKPLILVSNDDGINAKGIRALIAIAIQFGDVIVSAPSTAQSGMSHAITFNRPLRVWEHEIEGVLKAYSCDGTPVDAVKIALSQFIPRLPDLILSGINHGSNSALSSMYSGTVGAATEGSLINIPSIAFSLLDHSSDADFTACPEFIKPIIRNVLNEGLPLGSSLNVNIPNLPSNQIKGFKVCRQTRGYWQEEYVKRTDPTNRDYYWLTGDFVNTDNGKDHDEWALANGYVSILPLMTDQTDFNLLSTLKNWNYE